MLLRRAVSQCRWACGAAVASATVSAVLTGCPGAACSGAGAQSRYADDAQAGGHVDGVRFVGNMLHKRLQDEGRGDREAAALAALCHWAARSRSHMKFFVYCSTTMSCKKDIV